MTTRARRGVLAAPAALGALAAAASVSVGLGIGVGELLVRPRRSPRLDHEVLEVDADTVMLALDDETVRPGRYGLRWPDGHAVIGGVLERDTNTVTRVLERIDSGTLAVGPVSISHVAAGDPRSALGLEFDEVLPVSDVGAMPCWEVPAEAGGDTWVLLVHGYGGSRASALDYLDTVHRLGYPALCVAYRNDSGAPASPDRRYHLGASEWRDLDAAMDHAVERGARRLVILGWSMGGAIALQATLHSPRRQLIAGLVLDCPVLDWRAVIAAQGARRRVPPPMLALATELLERRLRIDLDALDWTSPSGAGRLGVPALVMHGAGDRVVPLATSLALAARRPDLVELEVTAHAGHVGTWNVDPNRYSEVISSFLARLDVPAARR